MHMVNGNGKNKLVSVQRDEQMISGGEDEIVSTRHEEEKKTLTHYILTYQFPRMKYFLDCGLNLCIYGVGSKRTILNLFMHKSLSHDPCLVVNGYHSGATIKIIFS